MQICTTLGSTLIPIVTAPIVGPFSPYLIESRDVIAWIRETLSETIRCEGDELCLRINQVHLLWTSLLGSEAWEPALHRLWLVLFGLDTVEDMLGLCLVVDASIISPAVRGKDECRDEVELTIRGSTFSIVSTVGLAAPGEIATYLPYGHRCS